MRDYRRGKGKSEWVWWDRPFIAGPWECLTRARSQFSGHLWVLACQAHPCVCTAHLRADYSILPFLSRDVTFCSLLTTFLETRSHWSYNLVILRIQLNPKCLSAIRFVPNSMLVLFRYFIKNYSSLPETWTWDKKGSEHNMGVNVIDALLTRHPKAALPEDFVHEEGNITLWRKANLLNLPSLSLFPRSRVASVALCS